MAFSDMVAMDHPLDCEMAAGFRGAVLQIVRVCRMELGASIMCVSRPRVLCLAPEMPPPHRPLGVQVIPAKPLVPATEVTHKACLFRRGVAFGVGAWPACATADFRIQHILCPRYSALGVQVVSVRP